MELFVYSDGSISIDPPPPIQALKGAAQKVHSSSVLFLFLVPLPLLSPFILCNVFDEFIRFASSQPCPLVDVHNDAIKQPFTAALILRPFSNFVKRKTHV